MKEGTSRISEAFVLPGTAKCDAGQSNGFLRENMQAILVSDVRSKMNALFWYQYAGSLASHESNAG